MKIQTYRKLRITWLTVKTFKKENLHFCHSFQLSFYCLSWVSGAKWLDGRAPSGLVHSGLCSKVWRIFVIAVVFCVWWNKWWSCSNLRIQLNKMKWLPRIRWFQSVIFKLECTVAASTTVLVLMKYPSQLIMNLKSLLSISRKLT